MASKKPKTFAKQLSPFSARFIAGTLGCPRVTACQWRAGKRRPPVWLQPLILKELQTARLKDFDALVSKAGLVQRLVRPNVRIFGKEYPVMRELEGGWKLIAHPNGPAIAIVYNSEMGLLASLDHSHEEIPERVRSAGICAYREMSWPKLRGDYHAANDPS